MYTTYIPTHARPYTNTQPVHPLYLKRRIPRQHLHPPIHTRRGEQQPQIHRRPDEEGKEEAEAECEGRGQEPGGLLGGVTCVVLGVELRAGHVEGPLCESTYVYGCEYMSHTN